MVERTLRFAFQTDADAMYRLVAQAVEAYAVDSAKPNHRAPSPHQVLETMLAAADGLRGLNADTAFRTARPTQPCSGLGARASTNERGSRRTPPSGHRTTPRTGTSRRAPGRTPAGAPAGCPSTGRSRREQGCMQRAEIRTTLGRSSQAWSRSYSPTGQSQRQRRDCKEDGSPHCIRHDRKANRLPSNGWMRNPRSRV